MTSDIRLSLTELVLNRNEVANITGSFDRMIFVVKGSITTTDETHVRRNEKLTGLHIRGEAEVHADVDKTQFWIWCVDSADNPAPLPLGATSKLVRDLGVIEGISDDKAIMRLDRVDFPPGAAAHKHVHPGPGIRIVLYGQIGIQQGAAEIIWMKTGEPWFEVGPHPVFAPTTELEPTAFIRCLILPTEWRGRNTISYVDPADAQKPKLQEYYRFCDAKITLPKHLTDQYKKP